MSAAYQVAAPAKPQIKPAFLVKKLEGKRVEKLLTFDAKGKRMEKEVEVDAGYLVKFPTKGHSIRVANEAELKRLGFDQTIPMLNEDGDAVFTVPNAINLDADGEDEE